MSQPSSSCRVCGAALEPLAEVCARCGTAVPTTAQTGHTLLGRPTPSGAAPEAPALSPDAPTQPGRGVAAPLKDDDARFAPGRVVLSHYRIVRRLGQGGMGAVYLAVDDVSGQQVAIKVLPAQLARERDIRERFVHEARALATLDHPAIVPLITFATVDEDRFLVMKYVDGEPLDARLHRVGPLDFDTTRRVLRTVVEALGYAHARGVVHRDVKPANVLLANDGRVFLVDFGIAKREQSTRLTQTGMLMGTPQYMSPEQISGGPVDGRSDLYAAGLVLFEMLTGRPPFEGEKTFAILRAHVEKPVPDPRELRGEDIPGELLFAVSALLRKDPEERPANAAGVLRILDGEVPAGEVPFGMPAATDERAAGERRPTPVTVGFSQETATGAFFAVEHDDDLVAPPRTVPRWAAALGALVILAGGALAVAFGDRLFPPDEDIATSSHRERGTDAPQPTDLLVERARGHLRAGRAEAAVALLEAAAADAPERVDVELLLVESLIGDRRAKAAGKRLEALAARADLDESARAELGRLEQLLEKRRAERAKAKKGRARAKKALPTDLDEAVLRAVAGRTRVAARNCYQAHALRQHPSAAGDVTLEATIEQSGKVSRVLLVSQKVGGPELFACLQKVAEGWRFPAFQETPRILFQYTFAFRPEGGAGGG